MDADIDRCMALGASEEMHVVAAQGADLYLQAQLKALGDLDVFRGLKIAVDAAHGAAYRDGRTALGAIGRGERACWCGAGWLQHQRERWRTSPFRTAEDGFGTAMRCRNALDGDADRCTLVDSGGEVVHGDALLLLLATRPGLVGTVMCNSALERALSEREMGVVRTGVGDRQVQMAMEELGWTVGGEPSGHVLLADALPTGDGLVTGLRALGGVDLRERLAGWEPYPSVQVGVRVTSKPALAELHGLRALLVEAKSALDGRILLRYSGTEPKLTDSGRGQRF